MIINMKKEVVKKIHFRNTKKNDLILCEKKIVIIR